LPTLHLFMEHLEGFEAILTADIVNSSLLEGAEFEAVLRAINSLVATFTKKHEFYRGDSFHALLQDPENGLELAILLRLCVRKMQPERLTDPLDIRIAIGLGTIDTPVRKLSTATGEAFVLSGRELDRITTTEQRLSLVTKKESENLALEILSKYTDWLISGLSPTQAEVAFALLQGQTETQIADNLKKAQPTINRIKKAAHYASLQENIAHYRKMVQLIKTKAW